MEAMEFCKGADGAVIPYVFSIPGCPPMRPEPGFMELPSSPVLRDDLDPLPKSMAEKEVTCTWAEQQQRDKKIGWRINNVGTSARCTGTAMPRPIQLMKMKTMKMMMMMRARALSFGPLLMPHGCVNG